MNQFQIELVVYKILSPLQSIIKKMKNEEKYRKKLKNAENTEEN